MAGPQQLTGTAAEIAMQKLYARGVDALERIASYMEADAAFKREMMARSMPQPPGRGMVAGLVPAEELPPEIPPPVGTPKPSTPTRTLSLVDDSDPLGFSPGTRDGNWRGPRS